MRVLMLSLLLPLLTRSSYVPGTPGAPWSKEEVLAVKAKIRRTFAMGGFEAIRDALLALGEPSDAIYNSTVYWGGTYPSAPKLLRLSFHDCVKGACTYDVRIFFPAAKPSRSSICPFLPFF